MAHDYDEFKVNKFDTLLRSIRESTRLIAETLQIPVIPAIGRYVFVFCMSEQRI